MSGNDFAPGPYLNPPPMSDDGGGGEALKDVSNIAPVPPAPDAQQAGNPRAQTPPPQLVAQAAQVQHHAALGKIASTLLGYDTVYKADPNTGQITPVQTPGKPGDLFRRILAGAIMGGVAGSAPSYDAHGNVISTPFNSAMKGAAGAMQYHQGQKQSEEDESFKQAQANLTGQQRQQQLGVEKDKAVSEEQLNSAHIAMLHTQQIALMQDSDLKSAQHYERENQISQAAIDGIEKAGGVPAQIDLGNGQTANGTLTMKDALSAQSAAHQQGLDITTPIDANHERVFYSLTDHSKLNYNGQRWVDVSGNAVNMDDRKTIQVFDIPKDAMKEQHPYTVGQLRTFAGDGFAPNKKPTDTISMSGYDYLKFQNQGYKNLREKAAAENELQKPAQKAQQLNLEAQRLHLAGIKAQVANDARGYTQARQGQAAAIRGLQAVSTDIGKQIATRQAQIKELDANPRPGTENQRAQLGSEVEALKQQQSTVTQQLQENVERLTGPKGIKRQQQSAPQRQPASTGLVVSVVTADGQRGQIPAQNVDAFLKAHPGSQRADQMQLAPAHQPNFTPQQ